MWSKATLDSLKRGGYLHDDSLAWCELVLPPVYLRGDGDYCETVIVLTDLEPVAAMPRRASTKGRRAS